jgi:hypothetical protein
MEVVMMKIIIYANAGLAATLLAYLSKSVWVASKSVWFF